VSYGTVTFSKVIEQSINTGIVAVALELGKERLHRTMTLLGFGQATGIDLPGESKGILRPVEQWTDTDLASAAFGQSVAVTGIQLARGLSAIANGGFLVSPYVVQPVEKKPSRKSEAAPSRVVAAEACATMRGILTNVIDRGTGQNAIIPGVKVAGKTGTAQKAVAGQGYVDGRYTSLFGCFLPAEGAELLFLVVLDEAMPYGGGATAAPVFHDVMLRWQQTGHFLPPSER
jgi:stage V sporulation protein D (sporulation-specific penicillin-binding protein)